MLGIILSRVSIVIGFGMPLVVAAHPILAQALPREELARLAAGEVIVVVKPDAGGASGEIDAILDIPAPPALVWKAMLDCERARRFLAGLEQCRVLQESPDKSWDVREHRVRWLWFLPIVRSVFRSDYVPVREIKFRRVEGDLKQLEGQWRLDPIKNGTATRLFYSARIDPGLSVPNSVVRAALEADIPKTLNSLRAEVERGERR